MASVEREGRLTGPQIVDLAAKISPANMEDIAEGYIGITAETIETIKGSHSGNRFKSELIRTWRNQNGGSDQIKVRTSSLHKFRNINDLIKRFKFLVYCFVYYYYCFTLNISETGHFTFSSS